jgi:hypothetical protein
VNLFGRGEVLHLCVLELSSIRFLRSAFGRWPNDGFWRNAAVPTVREFFWSWMKSRRTDDLFVRLSMTDDVDKADEERGEAYFLVL